jgi:hypothetical protein
LADNVSVLDITLIIHIVWRNVLQYAMN